MAGPDKPGGVSFGCPVPLTGGDITIGQLCSSIDEIIKWLEDIQRICEALPKDIKDTVVSAPQRGS